MSRVETRKPASIDDPTRGNANSDFYGSDLHTIARIRTAVTGSWSRDNERQQNLIQNLAANFFDDSFEQLIDASPPQEHEGQSTCQSLSARLRR